MQATTCSGTLSRRLREALLRNWDRLTLDPLAHTVRSELISLGNLREYGALSVPATAKQALDAAAARGRLLKEELAQFGQQRLSWLRQVDQQEFRVVALANSLSCSAPGQKLVSVAAPLALGQWASLSSALCQAGVPGHRMQALAEAPRIPNTVLARFWCGLQEEIWTQVRGLYLLSLFIPALLLAPICVHLSFQRARWIELVRWTLERAGPAFIKWGQWAATRPDLFPPDVCRALQKLHTRAPSHSFAFTRSAVEHAFGRPLRSLFAEFEEAPVASGSIAQVHRAVLSEEGALGSHYEAGKVVAVKVRHPGVTEMMQRDFTLMHRMAALMSRVPWLSALRLDESVRQFGAPLKEQLDLANEARHLARFNRNFRTWPNLSFPAPIYPLVAPDVLVETFEQGRLISTYVENPENRFNVNLANLGLDAYLKMLLNDNFIHADLHPGNIMVRVVDPNSLWGRFAHYFRLSTAPHLVLLDVGMTAELTPADQRSLVDFFTAITQQNGTALARNILSFSERQTCPNPSAFVEEMSQLFQGLDLDTVSEHTSEVIGEMMEQVRRHQVSLKGIVSTVVVTTLVLEGWSSKLNPDIKILDALRDLLPMRWHERIIRTVDRLMAGDNAAIA